MGLKATSRQSPKLTEKLKGVSIDYMASTSSGPFFARILLYNEAFTFYPLTYKALISSI